MPTLRLAGLVVVVQLLLCVGCTSTPAPRVVQLDESRPSSLATALADAQLGYTIQLAPGTYRLDAPLRLAAKGTADHPIHLVCAGPGRAILDFAAEAEDRKFVGVDLSGDYWQLTGIEVAHAGGYGFDITGSHNILQGCVSRENRNTGTQIDAGGSYNVIEDCESFRNFDPKTKGEDADGFTAKHAIGPGNVFRRCRSFQNADDGFDLWMSPSAVVIEDCLSYRNGYNIFNCPDFQGDGNGFKIGGNYVAAAHVLRRCVSIENPLHGFDQNHNVGAVTLEECTAIRCGKGFCFPELPRDGGKITLRRCISFGCMNVLEPQVVMDDCRWYADIPTGTLGPPPRPGHRDSQGAGEVPTTEPTPLYLPDGAPMWGRPADTPATEPYPEP
jgi:hypothetical protein